ncbi:MAG: AAA domain-containing protein [Metamycoplasmataceae bacterium]
MKKAIKQKLLNLVTINPIDYCVKTNLTPRHIDILKYVKKDSFINFINKEVSQIEISTASGVAFFEDELSKAKNAEEFLNIINESGFIVLDSTKTGLETQFELTKKKALTHFVSEMKSSKKTFIGLNRIAKQYYNDTAVWPLHISYRFLKGKINSTFSIKAPLILQKVELVEEGSKLFLRRIDDELIINEKLMVILNKEHPTDTNSSELLKPIPFNENIEKIEEMVGYKITVNEKEAINFIKEDPKFILENYPTLKIEESAVLGIFEPGGSALKQDLEKIIELDVDPFENQIDTKFKSIEFYEKKVIEDLNLLEINRPLNIFQKYAVASSLQQSTLIYGPPGTGKSEVIANIISNALVNGKNVLMASEKKAALDVLTSRMNSLSQFTLYLCDNHNVEKFYKKIDSLNTLLGTQWYREPSKYTRNAPFEPLKMDKDELMFFKNYTDWYEELLKLIKKHWKIEDYNDSIFSYDFSKYQELKNEVGEQIIGEWLTGTVVEGNEKKSIYESVIELMLEYNITKIDDFFDEYLKYKKFVKKFKLDEEFSSTNLAKQLKTIKVKITYNLKLVELFLLGGKQLITLFENYFEFKNIYENTKEFIEFNEKTIKQKASFLEMIDNYLVFIKALFAKKPEFKEEKKESLIEIARICEEFKEKHKIELYKNNWIDFFEENGRKIEKFLEVFNENKDDIQKSEIIFAEFVVNKKIITNIENCELPLKIVKNTSKNLEDNIQMFTDFVKNIEILESEFFEDFISFKEFFNYDLEFLSKLYKIRNIFTNANSKMLKEWSWLSLPYLKTLYLENFTLFDLDRVGNVMKEISAPISSDQFSKLKIISLWNDIVKEIPMFLEIKGIHLQDIITQLRKEAIRSSAIVEELIFKKYINALRNYLIKLSRDEKDEIANVLRIASSGTYPSITQFVKKYYHSLKKIFPVWVANPDNVADMVPLIQDDFDYGIFDEASQMSIERSYPLIYRTKIKVVSGDDKQLKPSSFFMTKSSIETFELDDFDAAESLLDRAKVSWWNEFHLKNHYRSDSKELIEFSNKFIYSNNLEVATKAGNIQKGIDVYNVNGTWNQINKEEADKTIELLIKHHEEYEKILVITFNSKQSQLIESMLIEKSSTFPELLKEKIENNNIIITNLENVQGNEGDLVILSISYGKNPEGIVRNNFGPLNSKGGSNRLNVAITRAKSKMIIIKSLFGEEIKVSNINNKNAIIFKKFIEYLDLISLEKSVESIEVIDEEMENLDSINEGTMELKIKEINELETKNEQIEYSQQITKNIYADLIKSLSSRYEIKVDYRVGSKNIDLLIVNKTDQKIIKAILIEKWKNNRTVKEMIQEIDRQYFLEDRGYSTFKVKEYEWNIDKTKLIEKIKNSLSNQGGQLDYIIWQSEK